MNLARREPRWAVTFTLLLALIAQVIPLPEWLSVIRPAFVALVIIYWSIYAPHAGGIFAPWLAGLALDVFTGEVLAQNALAIATAPSRAITNFIATRPSRPGFFCKPSS